MRFLFVLTTLSLALAGCNGGEDFSDATVPGCPAGAGCNPSSRGDVLVELAGPHVSNLGYTCTGTNVVFFTSDTDQQSVDSDGNVVTVPAFGALCPSGSQGVEFFIGNALFEGNYISVGSLVFPAKELAADYKITVSDLVSSPRREPASVTDQVRNVAAFIQGLDANPAEESFVKIPAEAHDIADDLGADAVSALNGTFTETDYLAFQDTWEDYFLAVDDAAAGGPFMLNPFPNIPLARVIAANGYSFAGQYRFDTCRSQLSAFFCDADENSVIGKDLRFPYLKGFVPDGQGGTREVTSEPPLVLPNGRLLGLGKAIRRVEVVGEPGEFEVEQALVAFSETAVVDESATLSADAKMLSVAPDGVGADVDMAFQGRFLNKRIYNDFVPDSAPDESRPDVELDYPSLAPELNDTEAGKVMGELLEAGSTVELPLTSEVLSSSQVMPDQTFITELASVAPFTVRLMRACLESDPDSDCDEIERIDFEVGSGPAFNYPSEIIDPVEEEMPREDIHGTTEFCLDVVDLPGDIRNGLITAGPIGDCGKWDVGFVSRTIEDPKSANLTMLLAPGAESAVDTTAPNFGVSIVGRVDMDTADDCYPLYRTGGPGDSSNFDNKVRAAWVDDYWPEIRLQELQDGLGEGETLDDEDLAPVLANSRGAVQFFAGDPNDLTCDPAAQP